MLTALLIALAAAAVTSLTAAGIQGAANTKAGEARGVRKDNFWNNAVDVLQVDGMSNRDFNNTYIDNAVEELNEKLKGTSWDALTDIEKRNFVSNSNSEYWYDADSSGSDLWGLAGATRHFNTDAFIKDVMQSESLYDEMMGGLEKPNYQEYYDAASKELSDAYAGTYSQIDADLAELAALSKAYEEQHNNDLRELQSDYDAMRSSILSTQHMQNASLMDTMRSEMGRSRRNALEAGASAGLRIASNINTALSVQNRQSQQSLETSNQLAQMLINQRAAERGLRTDYNNYMQTNLGNRMALNDRRLSAQQSQRAETSSLAQDRFNAANEGYDYARNEYLSTVPGTTWTNYLDTAKKRTQYTPK